MLYHHKVFKQAVWSLTMLIHSDLNPHLLSGEHSSSYFDYHRFARLMNSRFSLFTSTRLPTFYQQSLHLRVMAVLLLQHRLFLYSFLVSDAWRRGLDSFCETDIKFSFVHFSIDSVNCLEVGQCSQACFLSTLKFMFKPPNC